MKHKIKKENIKAEKKVSSLYYFLNMKKIIKMASFIGVFAIVLVAFYFLFLNSPTHKTTKSHLPLFVVADSANMFIAYAEGLGEIRHEKLVEGRLYRNFVQLLRMNLIEENLLDTFTTNCKTGVRIAFFKDTTFIDEFYLAQNMGREGVPGIWKPKRIGKINKFLKDIGVQYKPCKDSLHAESVNEAPHAILTMPKFGANRKNKKENSYDSIRNPLEHNLPEITNGEITNNVLNILDEIILPPDTAWGKPLFSRFKNWKRGEVIFYEITDSTEKMIKSIELTESQMSEFGLLLKETQLETFSMSELMAFKHYSKIILYGNDGVDAELWSVNKNNKYLVKRNKGKQFGNFEGYWIPSNQDTLKTFFDKLKGVHHK